MTSDYVATDGGDGRPGWEAVATLAHQFAANAPGRSAALVCSNENVGVLANANAERMAAGTVLALFVVATAYACDQDGRISLDHDLLRRDWIVAQHRGSILDAFDDEHRFSIRELCSLALLTGDPSLHEFLLFYVGRTTAVERAMRQFMLRRTTLDSAGVWHTTAADVVALLAFISGARHFNRVMANLRMVSRLIAADSAESLTRPGADTTATMPLGEVYVFGRRPEAVGVLLCNERWGSTVARREVDRFVDYLARQACPPSVAYGDPAWFLRHHRIPMAPSSRWTPGLRLVSDDHHDE